MSDDIPSILKIVLFIILSTIIFTYNPKIAHEHALDKTIYRWNEGYLDPPFIIQTIITPKDRKLKKVHFFGNGSCMPYARIRTGIQIFGSACTALERAPGLGYSTSTKPIIGSILVTSEGVCGHVLAVEKIDGDLITVSEQNFHGPFIVSERVININKEYIKGYIY